MKLRVSPVTSIAIGITMVGIGLLFHIAGSLILPGLEQHYRNRDLFRNWNGWTSTYMLMHPFLCAPVFSAVFPLLRKTSGAPSGICKGLVDGDGVFCIGSLPIFLLMFASLQVPPDVIAAWLVQNLVQYLAGGITLAIVTAKIPERQNI